jgi:putative transposase
LEPEEGFRFVKANQAMHAVRRLCRALRVSASGYYAWTKRKPSARSTSDAKLTTSIRAIYEDSRQTYGAPRVHAALANNGIFVGKKRVARLMVLAGIEGATRRKKYRSTRDKDARPAPDLVDRKFAATAPNQLWVADITYIPTSAGFFYLAVVLDVFSRRIVGWSMASHLRTELVIDALAMAVGQRVPSTVIHHSDQGCQYTSFDFGTWCREKGVKLSMGSVGDAYDNAMCESFFATLECELLNRRRFKTHQEAALAIFDFIEGFYNTHRLHSSLDYQSPIDYERQHAA